MKVQVECTQCKKSILRITWNYAKQRPMTSFFCDNTCKGLWQKAQRENLGYTKEWLFNEYVTLGKSANEIASDIGRDSKRVWEWITDYGIETRKRGSVLENQFKKGEESIFKGMKHSDESKELIRKARLKDGRLPCMINGVHWLHHYNVRSPAWRGGITPERQAFYSSIEWRNVIKKVWERDNATCQRCGKHHNEAKNRGTFHIHHIVSFMVVNLRAELSNLVLLCKECHLFVHSKENKDKSFILGE